jgi:molecular chaperone DnaK
MKDAEAHAEEDKKRREEIETRNRADQAMYAAEKFVQESGDKLGSEKAAVESAIASLKSALEANDTAAMTRAMEQLTQAQHKAAETLYKQAGPAPGAGGPGTNGPSGAPGGTGAPGGGAGDVIDAEVVDDKP